MVSKEGQDLVTPPTVVTKSRGWEVAVRYGRVWRCEGEKVPESAGDDSQCLSGTNLSLRVCRTSWEDENMHHTTINAVVSLPLGPPISIYTSAAVHFLTLPARAVRWYTGASQRRRFSGSLCMSRVLCVLPQSKDMQGAASAAPLDLRQKLFQAWGLSLYQFFLLRPSVRIQNHYMWFLIQYLLRSLIFRVRYFDLKFCFALTYPMLLLMLPFWWPWEILEVIFWSSFFFMLWWL